MNQKQLIDFGKSQSSFQNDVISCWNQHLVPFICCCRCFWFMDCARTCTWGISEPSAQALILLMLCSKVLLPSDCREVGGFPSCSAMCESSYKVQQVTWGPLPNPFSPPDISTDVAGSFIMLPASLKHAVIHISQASLCSDVTFGNIRQVIIPCIKLQNCPLPLVSYEVGFQRDFASRDYNW